MNSSCSSCSKCALQMLRNAKRCCYCTCIVLYSNKIRVLFIYSGTGTEPTATKCTHMTHPHMHRHINFETNYHSFFLGLEETQQNKRFLPITMGLSQSPVERLIISTRGFGHLPCSASLFSPSSSSDTLNYLFYLIVLKRLKNTHI